MSKAISEVYNVHISGKGTQPIVFAHGLGCDQSIWRFVAPAFEEDYKVVLFDYAGAGKSDPSYYNEQRHSSLKGYAEDLLSICKELELTNVIFTGHSVSCMIGLLAAIEQPSVFSTLIMLAPSACYLNDQNYKGGFEKAEIDMLLEMMDKNFEQWANYLAPAIVGNKDRPDLEEELNRRFCLSDREITKKFAKLNFYADHRKDLSRLLTDTLILQCSEDFLAPQEAGKYLEEHIPNSRLRLMQARGHCPHLSAPSETINAIKSFLKGG